MGFGSGGGNGSISGSSDVTLNNPLNNNFLTYDSTTAKWKNGVGPDTSLYPVIVVHNTNAATARPAVANVVLWYGTVQPTNMAENDFWHVPEQAQQTGFVGALDSLQVPYRAHSLRRLLSSYTGPAVKVRRSSDNTEQDIAFASDGSIDTTALLSFAGSGSAYISTWYDQSGSARHLTQATTAAQPLIVNSGAINSLNAHPSVLFDGTDDYLSNNNVGLYAAGAATVTLVGMAAQASAVTVFAEVGSTNSNSYKLARVGAGSTSPLFRASLSAASAAVWNATANAGDTTFDGSQHHSFIVDTGTTLAQWRDQTASTPASTATRGTAPTLTRTGLGAAAYDTATGFSNISVQELVAWGSDQSANRSTLSANQKSFWGTP